MRGGEVPAPTHRFVDHVGEVEFELEAADESGIFEAALGAFAELVASDQDGVEEQHLIELDGGDRALLLADWLSELAFLAEVRGVTPERLAELELSAGRLRATVVGRRNSPRHIVKAVTLNDLEFAERGGGWYGHVVLDV